MSYFHYNGEKGANVSFPLGGIGAGSVGLDAAGRFIDWEIFGRPAKNTRNGWTHFAVRALSEGKVTAARVLNGPLGGSLMGERDGTPFGGFGFGPSRYTMAGVPHFAACDFSARFPEAELVFSDPGFPARVTLRALSPFIPLDDFDSSLPCAMFELEAENISDAPLDFDFAFTVHNPLPRGRVHTYGNKNGGAYLRLGAEGIDPSDGKYGALCAATDNPAASCQLYWFRGGWFDNLGVFWKEFVSGPLRAREYPPSGEHGEDAATLVARVRAMPGERASARFVLAWYFPNMENYWSPLPADSPLPRRWKHWYATQFADAADVAEYVLGGFARLAGPTRRFRAAVFSSDLPDFALDAAVSNLAVLKSPTCLRLEDGSFYAFEGCHTTAGCCEGSCTHVWNYQYALPFLFPALERSMRELDYRCNLRPDGKMPFRLQLPPGREPSAFRACADGQLGGVVKVYREWKISGDNEWLRRLWPGVQMSLEYAWADSNPDRWDPEKRGVLTGRQHHTLDMELFGPNSWLTGFYLGALKAGAEMAEAMGDHDAAAEYRDIFERGKKWVDGNLFNGEYFIQKLDLGDRLVLEPFDRIDGAASTYWYDEGGELKYQIGEGCAVDQVLGQWHATLCGLGELFDPEKVESALLSIHRYNFIRDFSEVFNPCRLYALEREAGTVICSWPRGGKPTVPAPYSEECMNGFEYQAAAHLLQIGRTEEGMEMIRALRERYDGRRRNPWNEFECGSNYARSMASWAILPAMSGFSFDMTKKTMGFAPKAGVERCFWCLSSAWGVAGFGEAPYVEVLFGSIDLDEITLGGRRYPVGRTLRAGERMEIQV